jgi:hypothetical protein
MEKWPKLMQQFLEPNLSHQDATMQGAKTLEKIYHILFLDLMESLKAEGQEVSFEAQAGGMSLSSFVKYVVLLQGHNV